MMKKTTLTLLTIALVVACSQPPKIYDLEPIEPDHGACAGYVLYPVMSLTGVENFSLNVLKADSQRTINFSRGDVTNFRQTNDLINRGSSARITRLGRSYCTTGEVVGDPCLAAVWTAPTCWTAPVE